MKKEICWFWKKESNRRKTQEKEESENKVLALNSGENNWRKNNSKFFKEECNKCDKYGHTASDCWVNNNKTDNRNEHKTARKTCFYWECNICGKEVIRLLIIGRRKEKRMMMTSKTSLWDPYSMDKSKKRRTNKITKNG